VVVVVVVVAAVVVVTVVEVTGLVIAASLVFMLSFVLVAVFFICFSQFLQSWSPIPALETFLQHEFESFRRLLRRSPGASMSAVAYVSIVSVLMAATCAYWSSSTLSVQNVPVNLLPN